MSAKASKVLRNVVIKIGEVAAPGVGAVAASWDKTHEASEYFLHALSVWDSEGNPAAGKDEVRRAADAFIDQWKDLEVTEATDDFF